MLRSSSSCRSVPALYLKSKRDAPPVARNRKVTMTQLNPVVHLEFHQINDRREAAVAGSRRVHGVPEELHITMGGAVGRAVAVEIAMHIVEGGLDDARVVELLHTHLIRARAETAPGARTRSTSRDFGRPR